MLFVLVQLLLETNLKAFIKPLRPTYSIETKPSRAQAPLTLELSFVQIKAKPSPNQAHPTALSLGPHGPHDRPTDELRGSSYGLSRPLAQASSTCDMCVLRASSNTTRRHLCPVLAQAKSCVRAHVQGHVYARSDVRSGPHVTCTSSCKARARPAPSPGFRAIFSSNRS